MVGRNSLHLYCFSVTDKSDLSAREKRKPRKPQVWAEFKAMLSITQADCTAVLTGWHTQQGGLAACLGWVSDFV